MATRPRQPRRSRPPRPTAATGSDTAELLRRAKLKATDVRLALLARLREEHGPFTLEELHRKIGRASCDLVTMYRTLAVFQQARLVRRCDFGDGPIRYEFFDAHEHHHHVVCLRCRSVTNLDHCDLDAFKRYPDKNVPMIVAGPVVEMARRVGFTNVTPLEAWENTNVGDLTLTRVAPAKMADDKLWGWFNDIRNKGMKLGDRSSSRKNGSIVMYDHTHSEVARFNFFNAWPSKISTDQLSVDSTDAVKESITITLERLERVK